MAGRGVMLTADNLVLRAVSRAPRWLTSISTFSGPTSLVSRLLTLGAPASPISRRHLHLRLPLPMLSVPWNSALPTGHRTPDRTRLRRTRCPRVRRLRRWVSASGRFGAPSPGVIFQPSNGAACSGSYGTISRGIGPSIAWWFRPRGNPHAIHHGSFNYRVEQMTQQHGFPSR